MAQSSERRASSPSDDSGRRHSPLTIALQIASIYAVIGVVWILVSDRLATILAGDVQDLTSLQLVKGVFFVLGTAALLALLVHRSSRRYARAQELLAEREQYFRALFEQAPSAYQSLDAEGRILDVNEAWLGLLGWSDRDEVLGHPMGEFVEASQLVLLQERFSRFMEQGTISDVEFVLQRRDGQTVVVTVDGRIQRDPDGRMERTHCVLHDITQRKEMEQALRRSEEELRRALAERDRLELERERLFELSLDLFCVADMNGRMLQVNPAWTRVLGWSEEELRTFTLTELLHPEDQEATTQALMGLGRGEPLVGFVNRYRHRDGSYRWLSWSIRPDLDRRQLLATARDDTERRQLEDQLRHAQKMEAVGQLAGGVAHDFNNILQVINGYADLALQSAGPDEEDQRALREIASAGERAAALVGQLLAFSRREVINPEDLDLSEIVAETMSMVTRSLGEHIEVDWRPAEQPVLVRADRGQLQQVIMNLCINARDAMPSGGRLTLVTDVVDLPDGRPRARQASRVGPHARLQVVDTGVGMPPETLDRIWEPFFTTKDPGQGTGLGLSTVYGIVRQHGGVVGVASERGAGSTFEVIFPLATDGRPALNPRPIEHTAGGHETILVAEDSDQVRELVETILDRAGYRVLTAADGRAALDLLEQRGDEIDLALLDIVMPGLGGGEVYERVRDRLTGLKVIFSSGYGLDEVADELTGGNGCELIQKPFEPRELLASLRRMLDAG
jgi:PAS domain S-box-containing protein